jgi:LysR family transcriptional regulator, hydrogen peroxide-inducible genes activator
MQLQQIKYFLLLCEELSFTRAARRCNVAQPTLTKAMRSLERELGGPLFRRRPVELSALGEAIRPYMEQIAWADHQARQTARVLAPVKPEAASCEDAAPCLDRKAN